MATISEVARMFNVDRDTVKLRTSEFGDHLSRKATLPKGEQQQFNESDLRVLALVFYYWEDDPDYEHIHAILNSGDHESDMNQIRIEWWTDDGTQTRILEQSAPLVPIAEADWLTSNDRSLGPTLLQAAMMTDPESSRFSLGCLRLRGHDGQVAATDGRQAFTRNGFAFALDEVLVPAQTLGKLQWLVDLKIFHQGRFPEIERYLPESSSACATVTIGESDAVYLHKRLTACWITKAKIHSLLWILRVAMTSSFGSTVAVRFWETLSSLVMLMATSPLSDRNMCWLSSFEVTRFATTPRRQWPLSLGTCSTLFVWASARFTCSRPTRQCSVPNSNGITPG